MLRNRDFWAIKNPACAGSGLLRVSVYESAKQQPCAVDNGADNEDVIDKF